MHRILVGASLLLFLGMGFTPRSGFGQDSSDTESDGRSDRIRWSVLPIVFTSPDTDWAFGVLPQAVFEMPGSSRQSRIFTGDYYTLNKQYSLTLVASMWLNKDRDNAESIIDIRHWPTTFYGLNARNTNGDGSDYVEDVFSSFIAGSRRIGSQLRVGFKVGYHSTSLQSDSTNATPDLDGVVGEKGGSYLYLGPSFGLDTRNHVFYPSSGWLVNGEITLNGILFGGDYRFVAAKLDIRRYTSIWLDHVLAGQILLEARSNDTPFWAMKGIGSAVRGFPSARFVDQQMVAFQLEYRVVPVFWRFGVVGFVGGGSVSRTLVDLFTERLRTTYGLGIRFAFMRDDLINIRWDFGFGEGLSGDYLDITEAY